MKNRRLSKTSILRILPAAFVGLLPFRLLDGALLEAQYQMRGPRPPSARIRVVTVSQASESSAIALAARQSGFHQCLSFAPSLTPPSTGCLRYELGDKFTLEALESLRPQIEHDLNPQEKPRELHRSILFSGPLSFFSPMSASALVGVAGTHFLERGDTLVLIPSVATKPEVPIETPAGTFSSIEIALNAVSNAVEKQALVEPSRLSQFALSLLSTSFAAWILYSYPIVLTLIFTLILAAVQFVVSMLIFDRIGLQLPVAAPLISVICVYLLGMSDRLDRRERREWALEKEADALLQIDEMRSNFLSLVSHDLKTPIARMRAVLEQILRGDFGPPTPPQADALKRIVSASGHLQRTISTLLLLSRIESREVTLKAEPCDLGEILEAAVKQSAVQAHERNISIGLELEPLFLIEIDPVLIREVVHNLIDNSIKYSPNGTRIVVRCGELANCPELSPPQPGAWFEIQDQGPGIPKDERKRVFDKFVRGRAEQTATEESVKGTGLGLYLCAYFVQKHAGQITLYSRVSGEKLSPSDPSAKYFSEASNDTGTVMRVTLPIEPPPETPA